MAGLLQTDDNPSPAGKHKQPKPRPHSQLVWRAKEHTAPADTVTGPEPSGSAMPDDRMQTDSPPVAPAAPASSSRDSRDSFVRCTVSMLGRGRPAEGGLLIFRHPARLPVKGQGTTLQLLWNLSPGMVKSGATNKAVLAALIRHGQTDALQGAAQPSNVDKLKAVGVVTAESPACVGQGMAVCSAARLCLLAGSLSRNAAEAGKVRKFAVWVVNQHSSLVYAAVLALHAEKL